MPIEKEYTLKLSTADAQANVDELNKSLELQESLIDDIEKEVRQYEKQINKTSKTDLAGRKKLNDQIKISKERLKDEKIALKDLNKDRKKANEQLKEATENAADFSGVLGIVDQKTGGLISGMKNLTGGIGGATKGFNLLKVAIIGTGIGALLIAITAVTQAFKSSEAGQNQYAKLMGVLGAVVGVFTDRLASLGRGLISLFTDPIQTLKDFGKSIKEFVMDKVDQTVESLGFLSSAIGKLFKGDFSGALDDAGKGIVGLNKALNPVVIITEALVKSTKELIKELKEEGKIAGQIAGQRAAADKLDRQIIVDRAKANRDRAELLEKAVNKEKFSLQERIGFLQEAGKLEEEITNKEITAAQLRLDAKIAENALGDSTKQDLEEEAQLKANLINLETAKLTKAKEVTSQLIALKAEEIARLKEIEDAEILRKQEAEVIEAEKQLEKDEAEKERLDRIKKENEDRAKSEFEFEQDLINRKKQINQNYINFASGLSGLLSQIAGKNKAIALAGLVIEKGAAIANVVVKAQESIATSLANEAKIPFFNQLGPITVPNIQKVPSMATTAKSIAMTKIGAGIAIASIGASAIGGGGSVSGGTMPSSTPPAPSTQPSQSIPPAFNTVGASGTNQLADAIGGQTQQPVQAFVVSSSVTTAQELDRNIIDDATIG